jgi:hypothetical protein
VNTVALGRSIVGYHLGLIPATKAAVLGVPWTVMRPGSGGEGGGGERTEHVAE